jgi:D-alanyl-D-alanine carboxypeptidase
MQPYIIFFRGLAALIDESAAERLAQNRGCAAVFYPYPEWPMAARHVGANPDAPYHVVGFSRGAAGDVMGGFMSAVRRHGSRPPEDLMTVGLYHGTPRYKDPDYECINYLDSSGQTHVGEHDCVNLGGRVPHLGPGGGMDLVAARFATPAEAPSPPQSKSDVADLDTGHAEVGQTQLRWGESRRGGTAISDGVARDGAEAPSPTLSRKREGEQRAPASALPVSAAATTVLTKQSWPTQAYAGAFYGNPGSKVWADMHLVHVQCPWMLHMDKATLHQIHIHKLCAPSLTRVLAWVWETCGKDPEKIAALRYDRFSGSYNYRPMRGGAALSMHAYGAAIDWDDADNAQHSHRHLFTAASPLIKAFLDEGWEWGGNWSGSSIDAMHVQAAHVR